MVACGSKVTNPCVASLWHFWQVFSRFSGCRGASSAARCRCLRALARLPTLAGQPGATLQVDDNFDRAWRRVGLALDRSGFTVEDRDRVQGTYNVRYVDPKEAAKEAGFFSKLFGGKDPAAEALSRYRIQVKPDGNLTVVTVLTLSGQPDNSANAQRIVSVLAEELKF